ncbi:MAG: TauD/TfdA family dioxygenase [Magnetococcales bacterium]|nr:TauD/TfdA family dioxygenase [Magnetococcales bacterium]
MTFASPFDLDQEDTYRRWRDAKLRNYPRTLEELLVEVADPWNLTPGERQAILERCAKSNMALYRIGRVASQATGDKQPLPMALLTQLGVADLDRNLGAGPDGQSALTPGGQGRAEFSGFVPYSAIGVGWHSDGCYNPMDRSVRTLALHCVRPAAEGGANRLLDQELLYILLRDENPDHVRTLSHPQAMTVPPRLEGNRVARPARPGPVFGVHPADGGLLVRYSSRKKNLHWLSLPGMEAALAALRRHLNTPSPWHFEGRLEAGWGLISNNVLHTREPFHDPAGGPVRELYRARYHQRLPGPDGRMP